MRQHNFRAISTTFGTVRHKCDNCGAYRLDTDPPHHFPSWTTLPNDCELAAYRVKELDLLENLASLKDLPPQPLPSEETIKATNAVLAAVKALPEEEKRQRERRILEIAQLEWNKKYYPVEPVKISWWQKIKNYVNGKV